MNLDEIRARDARWNFEGAKPVARDDGPHDSWGKAVADRRALLSRITELESAIRDCCSDAGCFGNFDEACCISDEPVDTWCAPCKLSTYLSSPSSSDNLSAGSALSLGAEP